MRTISKNKKVFVAMSGGVDSSVAAALLKERSYEVIGVHMKCYNVDGCAEQDAEDARRAAEILGIPFYVFDFEKEYKDKVVRYMIEGYKNGITPNPDVMCNKEIKFGLFFEKALAIGADYVATGHYVRLKNNKLAIAKDLNKDQSYFLWTLKKEQLKQCLFPVGGYRKPQVRKLAQKFGLQNAEKKDSQGICFLGQVTLKDFLGNYIPEKPGNIIDVSGVKVGEHHGAHFYTIGQRHGVGISGNAMPYYVTDKNVKTNTIIVARGENHPALYRKEVQLAQINLFEPLTKKSSVVYARVRYRQPLAEAQLVKLNQQIKIVFKKPQKFVAIGQSCVFYTCIPSASSGRNSKEFRMLGGGIIK